MLAAKYTIDLRYLKPISEHARNILRPVVNLNTQKGKKPPIIESEIINAPKEMKKLKTAGDNGLVTEILKEGGKTVFVWLTSLFNKYMEEKKISSKWCNANIILQFKTGDKRDIKNCRPTSLLSYVYKLFMRIIKKRTTYNLGNNQTLEHVEFRSGYSAMDNIHYTYYSTINRKKLV